MSAIANITIGQYSSAGKKSANEDSFGVCLPEERLGETKGIAMAIADGMSSCEAPKEASETCIKSFLDDYFGTHESWTVKTSVARVLTATNRWLYSQGQNKYQSNRGMVSTFSGLILLAGTAHIFHIGDSRIGRIRDGRVTMLTRDHHTNGGAKKRYLAKAMGISPNAEVDYSSHEVLSGDIFVFTTDGVHEFVDVETMTTIIAHNENNLEHAAREIVERALENDSPDNATCQIVRIGDTGHKSEQDHLDFLTALPFPPLLQPGQRFDHYRIIRELHASNRTQIYLAEDEETGQKVAIKTPSVNFEDDPAYLEMFTREEWIGNLIDNPHVVKICPPKQARKFLYYVTEYIEGQTLRQWMEDNPRPSLPKVRDITGQIISGLRAFHRKEIIHQDIKPENIVIDRDGTVKLIDFGSARVASLQQTGNEAPMPAGTKAYSAPEFLLGYRSTNQSDIYSIGVIVYEMLTGKLPYGKAFDTRRALQRLSYISARNHNEQLPFWMDEALKKAVHVNRDSRYRSMSELLRDITSPNPEFRPKDMAPLIERSPIAFWKGLAAILFAFNVVLLYLLSSYL